MQSISQRDRFRDVLIASLCLLVFGLALSAKLAVYRDAGKTASDPVANVKLCLSGAKLDSQVFAAPLLELWLATFALFAVFAARNQVGYATPLLLVLPPSGEYQSERFVRPPPAHIPAKF